MTAPAVTDHDFLEAVRKRHRKITDHDQDKPEVTYSYCFHCDENWPCQVVQLVDRLAKASVHHDWWIVWSNEHGGYWGPNHSGYSESLLGAGLYLEADARNIQSRAEQGFEEARSLRQELERQGSAYRGGTVADLLRGADLRTGDNSVCVGWIVNDTNAPVLTAVLRMLESVPPILYPGQQIRVYLEKMS